MCIYTLSAYIREIGIVCYMKEKERFFYLYSSVINHHSEIYLGPLQHLG